MTVLAGRLAPAVIATAVLAALGCTSPTGESTPKERTGQVSDAVRSDPETLIKYFPLIGHPASVSWIAWDNSAGAPGPTIYWVDAVVELEPDTAARLRSRYAPTESVAAPVLKEGLRQAVPSGAYVTGPEFDAALGGSAEWNGTARGYLHPDRPLLVFQASAGG
ncbi:hypothetical protein DFR70_1021078 [Nocardia tenerifensis]|uniref:Lipoprotein n=1 Tax=Nocardia tenerifensis TaxID=228006 RepID=A0A318KE69_9NOCA|nr:hypothetical protein [Nocardia tenerifensis]PXX69389.1 hypothetical protein DFR70_1021078 [Nocardia tenerifensis]